MSDRRSKDQLLREVGILETERDQARHRAKMLLRAKQKSETNALLRIQESDRQSEGLREEIDDLQEKLAERDEYIAQLKRASISWGQIIYISPMGLYCVEMARGLANVFMVREMLYETPQQHWPIPASANDIDHALKLCKQFDDEWLDNPRPAAEGD